MFKRHISPAGFESSAELYRQIVLLSAYIHRGIDQFGVERLFYGGLKRGLHVKPAASGDVMDVAVMQSSGNSAFDRSA